MKPQRMQKKSYRTFEIHKSSVTDKNAPSVTVGGKYMRLDAAEDAASDMSLEDMQAGVQSVFFVVSEGGKACHSLVVCGAVFGVEKYDPKKHGGK